MQALKMNLKKYRIYILLSVYAMLLSFLCVGTSPILDYMDPDSQLFRILGRAMQAGQIAYVDIFDHKGPYVYFIEYLGAIISPNSEWGLFIIEVVCYVVNICLVYKLVKGFVRDEKVATICAMAFMAIFFNFFTFVTGNLTDSYSVTFQLISATLIVDYYLIKDKVEHPPIYMFVHGITASICLLMRPTNAGMWIPFGIILAVKLLKNGEIPNFLYNLVALFGGVVVVFLIPIVYCIKYNCFQEMWFGTITANMAYANSASSTNSMSNFLKGFILDPSFMVVAFAVISTVVVFWYCTNKWFQYTFLSMFVCSLFFMNMSMRNDGQYNELYVIFTIPFVLWFFDKLLRKINLYFWIPIILSGTLVVNLQLVKQITKFGVFHYYYESAVDMKEIMDNDSDIPPEQQLIFVTGLQNLYYNVTDRLPHMKYFTLYGYGLHYAVFPDATLMQVDSILSLENDYLIINYEADGSIYGIEELDAQVSDVIANNYTCVYRTSEGIDTALYKRDRL